MKHRSSGLGPRRLLLSGLIGSATLLVAVGSGVATEPATPGADTSLTAPATERDIAALIARLADPSFETRTNAMRRLCAIGKPASAQLRAAASSESFETARRAKQVLAILDQIYFAGIEVTLEVSKSRIAWNEPVDLIVRLSNPTQYAAKAPIEPGSRSSEEGTEDSRQVGDMLDLADWLSVVHREDGQEIRIRVDDIGLDPAVAAAVEQRLDAYPATMIPPGTERVIRIPRFNRGWARFPLLDKGAYELRFDYMPDWNDEALEQARAGRVTGGPVVIEVTDAAPDGVSRHAQVAALEVERKDDQFIAYLVNATDQAAIINLNFGPAVPFAVGSWHLASDSESHRLSNGTPVKSNLSWADFDAARLVSVEAGGRVELSRMAVADVRAAAEKLFGKPASSPLRLSYRYDNLCDRRWQMLKGPALLGNEDAPQALQTLLPRQVLAITASSNPLRLSEK